LPERRQIILRLIIIAALAIAFVLFLSKLFGRGREDNVVEGDEANNQNHQRKPSVLPILLLGLLVAGLVLFVLPRFGISLMGLLQKAIAFLPLIRGFLPF
jgi:flagellar basal body-associated protein FliL